MLAFRAIRLLMSAALVATEGCASEQVDSTSTVTPATEVAAVTATESPSTTSPGTDVSAGVSIAFVGYLMFARDVVTARETDGAVHPFERVGTLLGGTDLLVGNLEGTSPIAGRCRRRRTRFGRRLG
jgi:hypothetical protein